MINNNKKFILQGKLVFYADNLDDACDQIIKYFENVKKGEDQEDLDITIPPTDIHLSEYKEQL